jgi:ribose-phosphate pyrophosphokinase
VKRDETVLYYFEETAEPAQRLAGELGISASRIERHRFPDGESLVRIKAPCRTAIVYRSLDDPNGKLVELMLVASALRERGAERLYLVAPYLCYMRQDTAFHEGEAVSQKVVGGFLAGLFDGVVSVDPHLHRTRTLQEVFPGSKALALSATGLLANHLRRLGCPKNAVIVGPDRESRQWVEAIAAPLDLEVLVGEKQRRGDRDVSIEIAGLEAVSGRAVFLADDVASTGRTLIEAAGLLKASGAASVSALVVHMLGGERLLRSLEEAGIGEVYSSDSLVHETNAIALAPLLAEGLRQITA